MLNKYELKGYFIEGSVNNLVQSTFGLTTHPEVGKIIIIVIERKKWKLKQVKSLSQGHLVGRGRARSLVISEHRVGRGMDGWEEGPCIQGNWSR